MATVTGQREVALEGETWGQVVDLVLTRAAAIDLRVHHLAIDFATPSSASSPTLTVLIEDSPENRESLAWAFMSELDDVEWVA